MNQERMLTIVLGPHVSEKSSIISDQNNQVTFKVATDATKPEIAKAVELLFEVEVEDVRVINMKGKRKRFGQLRGKRNDWKKAYVRVKEGQDIDFTAV